MLPDDLPLLGTVMAGADVYEVREGIAQPVTIWLADRQLGHVSAREVEIACAGATPGICVGVAGAARLGRLHFRLRQAVGELIRTPDPDAVVHISHLEIRPARQAAP